MNVLTDETPAHSLASVEDARAFAVSIDSDTPHVAFQYGRDPNRTVSIPYTAAAFFHSKATGSLKLHRPYHATVESDAFTVDFEAVYEAGDLTITVERTLIRLYRRLILASSSKVCFAPAMGAGAPSSDAARSWVRCVGRPR